MLTHQYNADRKELIERVDYLERCLLESTQDIAKMSVKLHDSLLSKILELGAEVTKLRVRLDKVYP